MPTQGAMSVLLLSFAKSRGRRERRRGWGRRYGGFFREWGNPGPVGDFVGRIFRAIESSAPHASQEGERQRGELMRGQDTGGREHVVGPTEAPDDGVARERSRLRCFTGRGRLISVERTSGEWRGGKNYLGQVNLQWAKIRRHKNWLGSGSG